MTPAPQAQAHDILTSARQHLTTCESRYEAGYAAFEVSLRSGSYPTTTKASKGLGQLARDLQRATVLVGHATHLHRVALGVD